MNARFPTGLLIGATLLMIALTAAMLPLARLLGADYSLDAGDVFAGWNAAVAACAFVGLIITIRQQHREIEQTRVELRGQKMQMARQARIFAIQQFEGTFFNQLRLHHEIVAAMEFTAGHGILKGRAVLSEAANQCFIELEEKQGKRSTWPPVVDAYYDVYRRMETHLGHYFRNLYHIFKLVNDSKLPESAKRKYVALARAQLSHPESTLLFFNGKSEFGQKF
jgi:hypothetical protein